jgi:hypothetical protein
MLGAELQLALKFFEDFLEITVARPASQSVSVRHVRAAKIGATLHQNAPVDFAESGPTNENPSDRREGFCCALEPLQALGFRDLKPAVLGFPVVEARLADPVLPAQVGRLHAGHIGVLTTAIEDAVSGGPGYRAFQAELERLGFAEGRNLVTEIGRTDQGADRTFADAAAMARANVAVIISSGADVPLEAALAASPTIPIVMLASNYDPIARGYVASLARPGGRVTGFFYRQPELTQKRVELLAEAFPGMRRLAVLWDENSSESFTAAEYTAKGLALDLHSVKLEHPPYDFVDAFARVAESQPQMLLVLSSRFFAPYRASVSRHGLHFVFALVHDKRRQGDLGQQLAHIQVFSGLEIAVGAFGRGRLALSLGEFLELLLRSSRHEQR